MLKLINELIQFIKSLFKKKGPVCTARKFMSAVLYCGLTKLYKNTYVVDPKTGVRLFLEFVKWGNDIYVRFKVSGHKYAYPLFTIDGTTNTLGQVTPLIDKYILRFKGLLNE